MYGIVYGSTKGFQVVSYGGLTHVGFEQTVTATELCHCILQLPDAPVPVGRGPEPSVPVALKGAAIVSDQLLVALAGRGPASAVLSRFASPSYHRALAPTTGKPSRAT